MKKSVVLLILAISLTITSGCYDDNDTATVRISLGNLPIAKQAEKKPLIDMILCFFSREAVAQSAPADIIKLHLVALKNDFRIAVKSIDINSIKNNTVDFEVPSGKNITIVILGERFNNTTANYNDISHYGKTENPVTLVSGEVININIPMLLLNSSYINIDYSGIPVTWDKVPGASGYTVYNNEYIVLQSGQNNFYNSADGEFVTVDFSFVNKTTDYMYIVGK